MKCENLFLLHGTKWDCKKKVLPFFGYFHGGWDQDYTKFKVGDVIYADLQGALGREEKNGNNGISRAVVILSIPSSETLIVLILS